MNCCNDYGKCTGGQDCPVRPTKRLYACDQLGICNCLGDDDCINCNPLPPIALGEKVALALLTICTLGAAAGLAGYLWGTHGEVITSILYGLANRLG